MRNLFDYVYGAFYPILQIDQNDTFKPNMQIRLFHLQNSRSQRIVWFLEELGLPYELVINHYSNVFAGDQFTIADILMWFPLLTYSQNEHQFKHIQRYLAQIENRPAFKKSLIKGQWSASTFQSYWTIAW